MRVILSKYCVCLLFVSLFLSGCWVPPPGATYEQVQMVNQRNADVATGVIIGVAGTIITDALIDRHRDRYDTYYVVPVEKRRVYRRTYIRDRYIYEPRYKAPNRYRYERDKRRHRDYKKDQWNNRSYKRDHRYNNERRKEFKRSHESRRDYKRDRGRRDDYRRNNNDRHRNTYGRDSDRRRW